MKFGKDEGACDATTDVLLPDSHVYYDCAALEMLCLVNVGSVMFSSLLDPFGRSSVDKPKIFSCGRRKRPGFTIIINDLL